MDRGVKPDNCTRWAHITTEGTATTRYFITTAGAILSYHVLHRSFKSIKLCYHHYYKHTYRNPKGSYVKIIFHRGQGGHNVNIHTLVATYFCPKSDLFHLQIDHKDENHLNNSKGNLHWVTQSQNRQRIFLSRAGKLEISPLDKVMWYFGKEPWCFKK